MFKHILVPVDLTDKSAQAVEAAKTIAATMDASITILHVIELLDAPMEELEDFYQELEESARTKMEKVSAPLRDAGLNVALHIRYGKRVPEIAKFTEEQDVDLTVICSRRVDPDDPARTWMTISHQIAMLIATPVLIMK